MSGKMNGLQRRIRNFPPFNICISCGNHKLALCLPHLMKIIEYAELLLDYDAVIGRAENVSLLFKKLLKC